MEQYDNESYWLKRGEGYLEEFERHGKNERLKFKYQEDSLLQLLQKLEFETVLEVGCGFGRITKLVHETFKPKVYDAFDTSPRQIENGKHLLRNTNVNFFVSSLNDFEPSDRYDLILAVEVLMHISFDKIPKVISKLVNASKKFIVNLDWYANYVTSSYHCFSHDYVSLYKSLDCNVQTLDVKNPPLSLIIKRRAINQKIFLATKQS